MSGKNTFSSMLPILLGVSAVAGVGYYLKQSEPVVQPVRPPIMQESYARRIEVIDKGVGKPPFEGLVPVRPRGTDADPLPEVAAWMRFRFEPPLGPDEAVRNLSLRDQEDKAWRYQVMRHGKEFVAMVPTGMRKPPERLEFRYAPGMNFQELPLPTLKPAPARPLGPETQGLTADARDQSLRVYLPVEKAKFPLYTMRVLRSETSRTTTRWATHRTDGRLKRAAFEFTYPYAAESGKVQVETIGWKLKSVRKRIRLENVRVTKVHGMAALAIPASASSVTVGDGMVLRFSSQEPKRPSVSGKTNRSIVVNVQSPQDMRGEIRLAGPKTAALGGVSIQFVTDRETLRAHNQPFAAAEQGFDFQPSTFTIEIDLDVYIPTPAQKWKGVAAVAERPAGPMPATVRAAVAD